MRRARAVDEEAKVRDTGLQQQEEGAQRSPHPGRTGPLSSGVKLAAVMLWLWGLYISFIVVRQGHRDGSTTTPVVNVGEAPTDTQRRHGGARGMGARRPTFRELNMIGFEKDSGEGEEWRTCRAYVEAELAQHKNKNQLGHDEFLRRVPPNPQAKWELEMTEDQDAEWLGLHNFDSRFKYGSKKADERVKKLGYCRVHMPSVPRTGSTWFRAMFETATSQPSFSMWQEGGTFKENYRAFSSDDPCGASLDHMEGRLQSQKKFACRDLRPPNATSPILYKSHTPFFPSYNKPSLMPEETCMLVLLVRNPIDNHDAWQRYMYHKSIVVREYLPLWQGHLSHWVAAAGDIPIYVFRYEDMLLRAEEVLRRILDALPGGWNWSEDSIAKAMRLFGPKRAFEDKCGAGVRQMSLAEVEMVRLHYGAFMRHLGYRFTKKW